MIKVTITQDGERLDATEFGADNVIASAGGLSVVFRDAMQDCPANGLWHRVTHAAGTVAGRSYLRGADKPPEAVIDAPLSIGEAPDLPPHPHDDVEQATGAHADDDLYISTAIRTRQMRSIASAARCSVATRAATSGCCGGGQPRAGSPANHKDGSTEFWRKGLRAI
ncbi:hypothetical protein [Nitrobacter sp. 62-13]|jgi:hypothetical protein|uniref:hypothetical protein n=1 Tax=Nitrobacter sp. 62-13 TaxID=1895797 RepID=UPI000B2050D5|nr:hypothetical protein [Nitrobacter sp. 62-13]